MRVLWTYELPQLGEDAPDGSHAPLHWDGDAVRLPVSNYEHPREARTKDPSARGSRVDVHRVDRDGGGTQVGFRADRSLISQSWSFLRLGQALVLHVGTFHALPSAEQIVGLPYVDASDGAGRGVFLQHAGKLIFAANGAGCVYCYDIATTEHCWTLERPNRYGVGPLAIHHDQLVCFGSRALNIVDVTTGQVVSDLSLPTIDKLFPPTDYEGDLLLPYTNWTSGGLIRFDPTKNKVKWKFSRRGRISAPRGSPLPVVGRTAVLSVNDGSSLVGVDLETGQARWTFRAQWLYTPVELDGGSLVFGTAGGYGRHLRRHDAATGETEWAVPMEGGCPYYSAQGDALVAGDWRGVVRRVRKRDGEVLDELPLGAPVNTAPLVVGTRVYVLKWPSDHSAPALVALETLPHSSQVIPGHMRTLDR